MSGPNHEDFQGILRQLNLLDSKELDPKLQEIFNQVETGKDLLVWEDIPDLWKFVAVATFWRAQSLSLQSQNPISSKSFQLIWLTQEEWIPDRIQWLSSALSLFQGKLINHASEKNHPEDPIDVEVTVAGSDKVTKAKNVEESFQDEKNLELHKLTLYVHIGTAKDIQQAAQLGRINLKDIKMFVLEDWDGKNYDLNRESLRFILRRIPKPLQMIGLSRFQHFGLLGLMLDSQGQPVEIGQSEVQTAPLKEFFVHVSEEEKPQVLLSLLKKNWPKRTIIFVQSKSIIPKLTAFLRQNRIPCYPIMGVLPVPIKKLLLKKFLESEMPFALVTNDLAARALNLHAAELIIHYQIPLKPETYLRRLSLLKWHQDEVFSFSLIDPTDALNLEGLTSRLNRHIPSYFLDEAEWVKDFVSWDSVRPLNPKQFFEGLIRQRARAQRPSSKAKRFSGSQRRFRRPNRSQASAAQSVSGLNQGVGGTGNFSQNSWITRFWGKLKEIFK